jgi:Skp family chaperone for outer membrane proteins
LVLPNTEWCWYNVGFPSGSSRLPLVKLSPTTKQEQFMIKTKFAACVVLILAAIALDTRAQQATQAGVSSLLPDGKVVVINTAAFPEKIGELKQKYDQVNNQFKDRFQKLQSMDQQAKQLASDIETKRPNLDAAKLQDMQLQLDDIKKRGTRELEDLQSESNKALETQTKSVRDKLSQFISNYASQRGITLIVDLPGAYQSGILAFWSPSVDITEDFITEYNKANPVPAGAAPAPAQPSAQPKPPQTKPPGAKPQR